jgi:dihydroorotate dehydrogenase electron transfer subunit
MAMICRVVENIPLCPEIYKMSIHTPEAARAAKPGQFVHVALRDRSRILRRPISICDIEGDNIIIAYAIKGEGTRQLSELRAGDTLDMLAPLGRGFELEGLKNIAVVGGGIGIFPLLYALKRSNAARKTAFLGFRSKKHAVLLDEFGAVCRLHVSTDDGSLGRKGCVTDILKENWQDFDGVLGCGPRPMLRALSDLCALREIDAQISVEERMGCGLGGCLVCACAIKGRTGVDYAHVCVDGPVFRGSELSWEGE